MWMIKIQRINPEGGSQDPTNPYINDPRYKHLDLEHRKAIAEIDKYIRDLEEFRKRQIKFQGKKTEIEDDDFDEVEED